MGSPMLSFTAVAPLALFRTPRWDLDASCVAVNYFALYLFSVRSSGFWLIGLSNQVTGYVAQP